jgi:hypothetical protein
MSLLLFFAGGANVGPTHDKHDGGFAKKDWDRYQDRLRRRREELERLEDQDQKRKVELRKQLTRLYRGLPEEQKEQIEAKPATNQEQRKVSRSVPDFGSVIARLDSLSNDLKANQYALVNEWKIIEQRDKLRREQEDEEEIEMILLAVL